MPPIHGTVTFDNVEFAYEPDKPVLHGISFVAHPGTVTALVGSSGSGKSTIISLLCAFHTPSTGACWWTTSIWPTSTSTPFARNWAWCCRTPFSSTAAIRENIMFSRPDATEEQIHVRLPHRRASTSSPSAFPTPTTRSLANAE